MLDCDISRVQNNMHRYESTYVPPLMYLRCKLACHVSPDCGPCRNYHLLYPVHRFVPLQRRVDKRAGYCNNIISVHQVDAPIQAGGKLSNAINNP